MRLPDAERQLILLSSSTSARRSAKRDLVPRLVERTNWPQLTSTLRMRRLMPSLGPRIMELVDGNASESFAVAVEEATTAARLHGGFLLLLCQRIMSELADAGIRSAPLKGPMLSQAIYGDPGRRLSSDIDLLVSPEHLPKAVEIVRGLGYHAPTDYVDEDGLPLLHFLFRHEQGELPAVELHWRVHWYERSFACERLLPSAETSLARWRPDPADELAALLLFYVRDGFVDLRLATDLSAWWDAFGDRLPHGALDELIQTYPALARPIRTAATVAGNMVGLPTTQIIGRSSSLGLRERMAARLANPNPHTSRAQLYADMGFIDGLLMPTGDLGAFTKRHLLLPQEVLDEYAQLAPGWGAKSRLDYGLRVLARYGIAMLNTLSAPEMLG